MLGLWKTVIILLLFLIFIKINPTIFVNALEPQSHGKSPFSILINPAVSIENTRPTPIHFTYPDYHQSKDELYTLSLFQKKIPNQSTPLPLISNSTFKGKNFEAVIHYRMDLSSQQLIPLEVVVDKTTGPQPMRHQIILIHSSHYSHQPGNFVGNISKGLFKNQPAQFIIDFREDGSVKNMEQVNWSAPSKHKFIRFNYFEGHTDHLTFNGGENKYSMFDYQN